MKLMKKLYHSCAKPEYIERLIKHHFESPVKAIYWVKIKEGKTPNSLYFKIKHKSKSEDSVSFKMFKNVVEESGKMKIKRLCKS